MTTAADGKNYATKFYNLDVIISTVDNRPVDADFERAVQALPKPAKTKRPKKVQ